MRRLAIGLALLALSTAPATAGGDWDDDDDGYYYDYHHWRDYRATYGRPVYRAPAYEVYIPYGYYFADEPPIYGQDCEVERKWRHGRYTERIECDDD